MFKFLFSNLDLVNDEGRILDSVFDVVGLNGHSEFQALALFGIDGEF